MKESLREYATPTVLGKVKAHTDKLHTHTNTHTWLGMGLCAVCADAG